MSQDKVWWYAKEGQRIGPLSVIELKGVAASGELAPADLVWKEGLKEWLSASSVKGLIPVNDFQMPPPLPPLTSNQPIEKEIPPQLPPKDAAASQSPGQMTPQNGNESSTTGSSNILDEILNRIETLNIKESKKEIFRLIAVNKIKQVSIGIPSFDSDDKRLRPFKYSFAKDSIWNGWAFAFGPLYYAFTGIGKKGFTLFLCSILLSNIMLLLFGSKGQIINVVFFALISQMANYDLYRKKVLNEEFWW